MASNMPFIKNLASSDRKIRTSALASLHSFLSARQIASSLGPIDILKLWKGLFFAMWMCDRPIPQQNLCNELADLIFVLPRDAVVPWLRGFWATMSREWTGIDVLRMEKFLLLVRRVVGAGFRWMKKDGKSGAWDADRVDEILGLLVEWPLSLEDEAPVTGDEDEGALSPQTIPAGLRLQVLDVWVDEAEKVGLLDEDDEEAKKILGRIVGAVDLLEQRTTRPGVRIRSKESLADERLLKKDDTALDGDDSATKDATKSGEDDEGWGGFDD
ncbi:nucleolar protein,Nop52-domain-containing protein [Podospora conica]|nr:nucleolar protein,Nop52-domain-containing protein [Schizothecium conicum]